MTSKGLRNLKQIIVIKDWVLARIAKNLPFEHNLRIFILVETLKLNINYPEKKYLRIAKFAGLMAMSRNKTFLLIILICTLLHLWDDIANLPLRVLELLGFTIIFGGAFYSFLALKILKSIRREPKLLGPYSVEVETEGLRWTNNNSSQLLAWQNLSKPLIVCKRFINPIFNLRF